MIMRLPVNSAFLCLNILLTASSKGTRRNSKGGDLIPAFLTKRHSRKNKRNYIRMVLNTGILDVRCIKRKSKIPDVIKTWVLDLIKPRTSLFKVLDIMLNHFFSCCYCYQESFVAALKWPLEHWPMPSDGPICSGYRVLQQVTLETQNHSPKWDTEVQKKERN